MVNLPWDNLSTMPQRDPRGNGVAGPVAGVHGRRVTLNAHRSGNPQLRRLMLALFACALFVRALVPAGWMPDASAGGLRFAICNGTAESSAAAQALFEQALGKADSSKQHDKAAPGNQPCAFAGTALALTTPDLPALAAAPQASEAVAPAIPAVTVAIGRGLAAPPPPATGPPVRV